MKNYLLLTLLLVPHSCLLSMARETSSWWDTFNTNTVGTSRGILGNLGRHLRINWFQDAEMLLNLAGIGNEEEKNNTVSILLNAKTQYDDCKKITNEDKTSLATRLYVVQQLCMLFLDEQQEIIETDITIFNFNHINQRSELVIKFLELHGMNGHKTLPVFFETPLAQAQHTVAKKLREYTEKDQNHRAQVLQTSLSYLERLKQIQDNAGISQSLPIMQPSQNSPVLPMNELGNSIPVNSATE